MQACGVVETAAPCNELAALPFSLRVYWDRIPSEKRGLGDPPPISLYLIEYYRVEVSSSLSFQNLVANRTCQAGQADDVCIFDERVALVTGLTKAQVYFFRVLGGTIIGDGENSTIVTSPRVAGGPGPPTVLSLRSDEVSTGVLNYFFRFREPADTGDGLSTLPVESYLVEVSAQANFGTVVASATLDSNYPGGLQQNMTWSPQAHPNGWGTLWSTYFFRVRAENQFSVHGAIGVDSAVLSRALLRHSLALSSVDIEAIFALQVDVSSFGLPSDTGVYASDVSVVDGYIAQLSLDADFSSVLREGQVLVGGSSISFYFLET